MRCVAGVVTALLLVAGAAYCEELEAVAPEASAEPAPADAPSASTWFESSSEPKALFFSGLDGWRNGSSAHGGLLWSPAGLYTDGFTLKAFGGAGTYRYRAGAADGVEVAGQQLIGALMPGWRFKWDKLELAAYAGLDLQQHQLLPDDPANRARGFHVGGRVGADIWHEPLPDLMTALNVSASSINWGYWTRAAFGWRVLDALWLGPEGLALGDLTYRQYRVGLHATGWRTLGYEWSAGAGWVVDSDRRDGFYARIGALTRK